MIVIKIIIRRRNIKIEDQRHIVKKPKSTKNYINGNDFYNSIVKYYKESEETPEMRIPKYIGECILKIAERLGSKINFSSYSFKEEMQFDGIEKMVEAVSLKKYDINLSNPFAYFTQICWNSFLQRMEKEKKQSYIKHKNFERMFGGEEFYNEDHTIGILDLRNDLEHVRILDEFERPKTDSSAGYKPHKNLSYIKNRKKKTDEECTLST